MRTHGAKTRTLAMPYKDSDLSQNKSRQVRLSRATLEFQVLLVLNLQPNFHKDPCKEAKMRALAMPYKYSDPSQQKSRKCVFRPFLNRH